MLSTAFTVTVNGKPADVAHAAANYDYVSFDITGPVDIEITAAEPHFWDRGVDIQPWRLGLRADRTGQTIRFRLPSPAKLAISRPRDFLNHAKKCFSCSRAHRLPPPSDPTCWPRIYKPGVYRQEPQSQIRRHALPRPGFLLLRRPQSLEKVENVRILGRGTIVYDGPQDPDADEGWMQKLRLALRYSLRVASRSRSTASPASSVRAPGLSR